MASPPQRLVPAPIVFDDVGFACASATTRLDQAKGMVDFTNNEYRSFSLSVSSHTLLYTDSELGVSESSEGSA